MKTQNSPFKKRKRVAGAERSQIHYAASEQDADMLYLSGMFVPDPFWALIHQGQTIGVFNRLEYSRAVAEGGFDEVLSYESLVQAVKAKRRGSDAGVSARDVGIELLTRHDIRAVEVPAQFPASMAFAFENAGIDVGVCETAFFPQRELKQEQEADGIRQGNTASAAGIAAARKCLRDATVGAEGVLIWEGEVLTSERLRTEIDVACLRQGAVAKHTICAGGDQACDPHCGGAGPLRANELIIVDVFPRVGANGFHGDMTRTFIKGQPSEAQRALYETVLEAQKQALSMVSAGVNGRDIHDAVSDHFEKAGYRTELKDGQWVGFFHGTGHGLGLEVHERPRVSTADETLAAGMVVTIEPGLYYPGLGGCRIEDVVLVTETGYELLSSAPYDDWIVE